MNCIRCGKEAEEKAVFCPECLEDMAHYPVKPGTVIRIPSRPEPDAKKQTKRKRELTAEEQLSNALDLIQVLFVSLIGLLSILIVTGLLLVYSLSGKAGQFQPEETQAPVGRNYTIISPAGE